MSPDFIKTICPYCGVGCGLVLKVEDGKVVGTYPDKEHPVSRGTLCIKGWSAHEFVHHPERLKTPLVRKGDAFEEISWNDAIALAAEKLKGAALRYGGDAVGGLSSAKCTNEENYIFEKMIRMAFKTNNVDHCARLCHAPTAVGMGQTTGSGAMTNSISDLAEADCILVIGSNAAESHPIIMGEIYKAVDRGAVVIVVDPRKTAVAENARIHLRINPGTDIPLLTGMMRHITDAGLHNEKFIKGRMEGFDELKKFLQSWPVERAAKECGIAEKEIRHVAEMYAKAKDAAAVYCMGITQHACGTANVHAVCDLAMLCGKIGKTFSGVNPLRGQNNVQGACDMGALPNVFPGYQKVEDPAARAKFEAAWGVTLPEKNGLMMPQMMDGLVDGKIKFFYVFGENLANTEPDIRHVEHCLESAEFMVCHDIFPTETTRFADVIFPAAAWSEDDGTFSNSERRVSRVRQVSRAPGQAKPNWWIFKELAKRLGQDWASNSAQEIWDNEVSHLAPSLVGVKYYRLEGDGLQWPVPNCEHPGTCTLHQDGCFTCGQGRFAAVDWTPPAEVPDEEYPLVLSTGRRLYQYHSRTQTGRCLGLNDILGEETADI